MRNTRWLAVVLALVLLLALTACTPAQGGSGPKLSITSTIFGSGDTGGKTTLKNILVTADGPGDQTIRYSDPSTGERLDYPVYNDDGTLFQVQQPPVSYTGSAVLTLEGEGLDDSKIDSSNAVVSLLPGDGYYAEELILKADRLEGDWNNGTMEYTLQEGDLEWNVGDYQYIDGNSGREWSILGGDGNGCYTFNFGVSGIVYDGKPVEEASFQVKVYIWGRTGTDLAPTISDLEAQENLPSGTSQSKETQWIWVGEQGDFMGAEAKPILCDGQQDDFFIVWPTGSDASALTASDVTVTLNTQYGQSCRLKSAGEHIQYAVFSGESETQIAVTFRHAASIPVFNTMTIAVDDGNGLTASKTYDIASVYTYMVQQGGGGLDVDGITMAYSYYGYEGLSEANATAATYTLKYQDAEGKTWYYNVAGGLSEAVEKTSIGFKGEERVMLTAPDDAAVFDAMGADDCDVQFVVNTLLVKTRLGKTEVKAVDGGDIVFSKEYTSGQISDWSGVTLAPGYVRNTGISPNQQWAWSQYYGSGWSPELDVIPTDFPYVDGPFGSYADRYDIDDASGEMASDEPDSASGEASAEPVSYTGEGAVLTLNETDGTFTLSAGSTAVEGRYTSQSKFNFRTKELATIVIPDEASARELADAGVFPAWYVYLMPNEADGSFTISKDVSYALISDESAYSFETRENEASVTGYTTTITVQDNGYDSVYAYGDWVCVDENGAEHGPDTWANGMNYSTSSILPLEKNADGNWTLRVDLASSVMGAVCYRDVQRADLQDLFPQKLSFYVPYDSEKQSGSFDWTAAFPASITGVPAGRVYDTTCTVDGEELSVSVYTPAGYSQSGDAYPVVYLIPGGGSDYMSWFKDGMVNNVLDNRIASGAVEPTILVSVERTDVNGDDGRSFLGDIIAWVEQTYNVAQGAENRALVGVSMGSVAASRMWLEQPESFGYYAFLSGGEKELFKGAAQDGFAYETLEPALLEKLRATNCFLGGGTSDFNMYDGDDNSASVTDMDAWMSHYEIGHNESGDGHYDVTDGDHNWPIWMKLMMTYTSDYLWK